MRFAASFVVALGATLLSTGQQAISQVAAEDPHAPLFIDPDDVRHEAARRKLKMRVRIGFDEVALKDAVQRLAEAAKTKILLDDQGLQNEQVEETAPVSLPQGEYEVGEALTAAVKPLRLGVGFDPERGALTIQSLEDVRRRQHPRIYPVADLALIDAGDVVCDVSTLLGADLVSSAPNARWKHLQGDETLGTFHSGFALVGFCSRETHEALERKLSSLRQERSGFRARARRLVDLYRQSRNAAGRVAEKPAANPRQSAEEAYRNARRALSILRRLERMQKPVTSS